MAYQITTQKDLRDSFWESHPTLTRKGRQTQNDYPANTRMAWCDYVEFLSRDGLISEALAQRATL
jgi:hypothetical protein